MTLSHFILRPYGGDMKLPAMVFADIRDWECKCLLNKEVFDVLVLLGRGVRGRSGVCRRCLCQRLRVSCQSSQSRVSSSS